MTETGLTAIALFLSLGHAKCLTGTGLTATACSPTVRSELYLSQIP